MDLRCRIQEKKRLWEINNMVSSSRCTKIKPNNTGDGCRHLVLLTINWSSAIDHQLSGQRTKGKRKLHKMTETIFEKNQLDLDILVWLMSQPLPWSRQCLYPIPSGQSRRFGFTLGQLSCRPSSHTVYSRLSLSCIDQNITWNKKDVLRSQPVEEHLFDI